MVLGTYRDVELRRTHPLSRTLGDLTRERLFERILLRGLSDVDVARLIELSYRCNLCRRCAQTCPIGVDNGLLAREIRKIASQEMGLYTKELHDDGPML